MSDQLPVRIERAETSLVGVAFPPDLELSEWKSIGRQLCQVSGAQLWWMGDWQVFGEANYGADYAAHFEKFKTDVAAEFGYADQTLRLAKSVAARVPLLNRFNKLSFSHHEAVAHMPVKEQKKWLTEAAANNWPREKLKAEIRAAKKDPNAGATHQVKKAALVIFNEVSSWFRRQPSVTKWPDTQLQNVKSDFDNQLLPKYREIEAEIQRRAAANSDTKEHRTPLAITF